MREHLYKPHTMRPLCHSLLTHPKSVCPVPCHMCPVTPEACSRKAIWLDMKLNALKGPAHRKNENLYFSAPAQTKRLQPILVSCEAPLRSNLQKKPLVQLGSWSWSRLVSLAKNINFHFCYGQAI